MQGAGASGGEGHEEVGKIKEVLVLHESAQLTYYPSRWDTFKGDIEMAKIIKGKKEEPKKDKKAVTNTVTVTPEQAAKAVDEIFGKKTGESTSKGASLKDVLEMDDDDLGGDVEPGDVVQMLEKADYLKKQLDEKVEGSMAYEYKQVKEQLSEIQSSNGLEGLRHNRIVFIARWQQGRTSFDQKKLAQELVMKGWDVGEVKSLMDRCTKQGEDFLVREIKELK